MRGVKLGVGGVCCGLTCLGESVIVETIWGCVGAWLGSENCNKFHWFIVASVSGMASIDLLIIPMPDNVAFLWI